MEEGNNFYVSFRPILIFSQLSGLMPLRGIFGNNPEKLRFTWTNPLHFYGLGVTAITALFDYVFTRENLKQDISIDTFASSVFYTVCLLTTALFLRIALRIPDIANDFLRIERCMVDYTPPKNLRLRIATVLTIFALLATVEHGTMGVLHFMRAIEVAKNGTDEFGPSFFEGHFGLFASKIPYSGIMTIIFTWSNAICTFNWNFLDFFLMGISLEMTAKFNQITDKLISADSKVKKDYEFWKKVYTDYNRIVLLLKKLDGVISGIILTSFFSSLYHLSLQLLRSLKVSGSLFHKLYFYFSLSYLILRLLSTLFHLANVHEAGKKPADFLHSLDDHCTASQRLLEQILTDDIYFTGNRIFTINRSFVISVIGTIITYQVVLLQLNSLSFIDT